MATRDNSDSSEDESKEEPENMKLMASTGASESDSDSKEVFSHLTRSELELTLVEILEKSLKLQK